MDSSLRRIIKWKEAGELDRAAKAVEDALRDETPRRIELLRELADIRAKKGQWRVAHDAIDSALKLLRANGDAMLEHALLERRAWVLFREGKLAEARQLCGRLIEAMRDNRDANGALLADLHNTLGGILWYEGRIDEAMAEIAESIALYDATRNAAGAAHSRLNLGVLCFARGDWKRARRYLVQSRRIRVGSGCTQGLASNLLNLGLVEMASGKLTVARRYLNESASASRAAGEEHEELIAELALAQADVLEHRFDSAGGRVEPILRARRALGDDIYVQALWLSALVEQGRGNLDRALDLARDAHRKARANGIVETEADVCRALGIIYRTTGALADAKLSFDESIRLAKIANDPYRRALALFESSTVTRDRAEAEEAVAVFKRLGAHYDLTRARFSRV